MTRQSANKIDTTRVPMGERAARALVDAVVAGDDRLERHYLEIKGPLDLTTKRDQAKLAKFVLGAANRMPDKAAKAFEGYAVMVIGASKGVFSGVPPIEVLELQKAIQPFTGADGPDWDIVRVAVPNSSDEVLLLIVDPPKWGQQPFVCLKEGGEGKDNLINGAIYVRADGETRAAKADEIKELLRRGEAATTPAVEFDVSIIGEVERISLDYETACNDYINAERARLLEALAASKPKPAPGPPSSQPPTIRSGKVSAELLGLTAGRSTLADFANLTSKISAATSFMDDPERRTEAEYEAEIDAWDEKVRKAWPAAVNSLVVSQLKPVTIQLANRVETYFHDVQLKIHLEGEVRGDEYRKPYRLAEPGDLGLPAPPRKWGPRPRKFDVPNANYSSLLAQSVASNFNLSAPSRIDWHNSGSVDITFDVGDLRPTETDTCTDGDLALTVPAQSDAETIRGTWEITANGHNKVYKGDLEIPVVGRDLTRALRAVLGLDERPSNVR